MLLGVGDTFCAECGTKGYLHMRSMSSVKRRVGTKTRRHCLPCAANGQSNPDSVHNVECKLQYVKTHMRITPTIGLWEL